MAAKQRGCAPRLAAVLIAQRKRVEYVALIVLTVQTRQLLQSGRKEQLQKFDPLPAGAQTVERGVLQSLAKESYGIVITSESDQRIVQFDGGREVFEAIDFEIIINLRHCFKVR